LSVQAAMMDLVTSEPVGWGPLIGRTADLGHLMAAVGLGASEPGGADVLLAGDAGVGKTRLQAELRERATAAGWRVLVGHCLDFGDSASPYLPFSEVFVRLAAESPGLLNSLVESHPALARLLPLRPDPADQGRSVEPVNRADLFESVHAVLERLSRSAPVLLLIEDVHWADRSTRDLLSFFFTRPFSGPVSVVVSYRSDDLHRRHPLRAAVAEWARLPAVSRLHLDPLPDEDVRTLVGVLLPKPISARAVRGIVERAEGNAFFAEELVAAAGSAGASSSLPDSLAELLLVRLDQLDPEARSVVRAAAVAGRRVAHSLLAAVVDTDSDTLDRGLRAAVESNVLIAVQPDGYAFRHALLAEAVYDDLLPGERVRLHAAYARALSAEHARGSAADLARHARAADDRKTALHASVRAGDEAMALAGPDEAARHYELALELLAKADGTDEESVDPTDLSIKASEAAAAAGHLHRAVALVQDQVAQLNADTPPLQRARLLLALGGIGLLTDSGIDVLRATTEALPLVPTEPATPLRARLLSLHARANAAHRRDEQAVRWSAEALQMAHELGLADVIADVTTTMAHIEERRGDPESSRILLVRNIEDARQAGEPAEELRGLFALAIQHFEFGRIEAALAVFQTAADRAVEVGRPWAPYGFDARSMAGVCAYIGGQWDYVLEVVDVTGESPPALAEATLAGVGLSVAAGRGEQDALETLSGLRESWDLDGMIAILCGSAAIDLHGDTGDFAAATAAYNDVVTSVSRLWRQEFFQARMRLSGLMLGQLCARAARSAAQERPALAEFGDELVAASSTAAEQARGLHTLGPEAHAWLGRVSAEHARLRWLTGIDAPDEDDLVKAWRTSVELFDAFGHVFEGARSHTRLASVLRAVGRSDEAATSVATAREVAHRLGAEPLLAELRVLGRASPERRSAASKRDTVLTPREQEVLQLVAQGRSNADIARHLYISAKTVSVHVSNILAKLGAGGRTEAVALARRDGILSGDSR
jgi:DNA-binding CsgD family transcriptional regulator/tetratricopeptide (TPR) repeat protein